MKSAEMELVRVDGDVIMASVANFGSGGTFWNSFKYLDNGDIYPTTMLVDTNTKPSGIDGGIMFYDRTAPGSIGNPPYAELIDTKPGGYGNFDVYYQGGGSVKLYELINQLTDDVQTPNHTYDGVYYFHNDNNTSFYFTWEGPIS